LYIFDPLLSCVLQERRNVPLQSLLVDTGLSLYLINYVFSIIYRHSAIAFVPLCSCVYTVSRIVEPI